ncbi:MAG TPA: hypothetical protein DEB09_05130 [Candidatus Magasanikbacteria bacterium]|nr:hypothetical protein [Candidatus Magasanikbacteria bacterium]
MSFESEQNNLRRSREGRESSAEQRENKEGEANKELQAAVAMERADVMIREVKNSQKQMQNIVRHMQEVQTAIRQLRAQLQLAQTDDDVSSLKQDKKKVEELKKKIGGYLEELEKMRGELVREQMEELKNGIGVGMTSAQLQKKAEEMVQQLIDSVKG